MLVQPQTPTFQRGDALAHGLRSSPHRARSRSLTPHRQCPALRVKLKALHAAGVDIITGTDASVPVPSLGGLAHGASVHHELQYLVRAGLSPIEALRAATATPARRFGLADRGRIAEGLRADLVLVDGDPTTTITDTLNLRSIWRRGRCMSLS